MSKHTNYIRTNDCLVMMKQLQGEWIPNFKEGTIYSTKAGRYLKPGIGTDGYYHVRIRTISGVTRRISVHRALWVMKNGIPYDTRLEVDHINHIQTDNRIQNLRLVTQSENVRNRPEKFAIAERIRQERESGATTAELSVKYNYSPRMIQHIVAHDCYDPKRYPGTKTTPHIHLTPYGDTMMGWRK